MKRLTPALWILVAIVVSGVALVAAELGSGALNEPAPKIADPCQPRPGRTGGIDTTIQRVVLDGLDAEAARGFLAAVATAEPCTQFLRIAGEAELVARARQMSFEAAPATLVDF